MNAAMPGMVKATRPRAGGVDEAATDQMVTAGAQISMRLADPGGDAPARRRAVGGFLGGHRAEIGLLSRGGPSPPRPVETVPEFTLRHLDADAGVVGGDLAGARSTLPDPLPEDLQEIRVALGGFDCVIERAGLPSDAQSLCRKPERVGSLPSSQRSNSAVGEQPLRVRLGPSNKGGKVREAGTANSHGEPEDGWRGGPAPANAAISDRGISCNSSTSNSTPAPNSAAALPSSTSNSERSSSRSPEAAPIGQRPELLQQHGLADSPQSRQEYTTLSAACGQAVERHLEGGQLGFAAGQLGRPLTGAGRVRVSGRGPCQRSL